MEVGFVKPKNKNYERVDWKISERVRAIVDAYAEYAEMEPYQLVDEFLGNNLIRDPEFLSWVESRRYNVRIMDKIFPDRPEAMKRAEERRKPKK